jgi:hypothetical protein
VINVKQNFAGWAAYSFADHDKPGRSDGEKDQGLSLNGSRTMINPFGSNMAAALRRALMTLIVWYSCDNVLSKVSWYYSHPFCMDSV